MAGVLLVAVVPFTLLVIKPTNRQLLDETLDAKSSEALALLARWGRLHALRTAFGLLSFLVFVWRLVGG